MSQPFSDMFQDYPPNRSPVSSRTYGNLTLNRQTSRQFMDSYQGPLQGGGGLYAADDHSPQYNGTQTGYRGPSNNVNNYAYESQTWNYGGANGVGAIGGTGRIRPQQQSRRAEIPSGWMNPATPSLGSISQGGLQQHNLSGMFEQPQHAHRSPPPPNQQGEHEELIPTAIVIKNIPFAVKKEQLTEMMSNMGLPLPYAFNYHFDNGVFRGLAFANFTDARETQQVIDALNHMELQGRKLRVEYKKMLPAAERDRIERDKRERRGQLEEQHRAPSMMTSSLHTAGSMTSMNSGLRTASPSPVNLRQSVVTPYDLNDPTTLSYYTELLFFKNDADREAYTFPPTISPADRRIIHTLAHNMGLEHHSQGHGDMRQVQIVKTKHATPPMSQMPSGYYNESQRRGLNRAATIDFSEARAADSAYQMHTLGRQGSGLLDIPGSPGVRDLLSGGQSLRAAKSFADLRSYSPSPVPSSASFPANLNQNIARFTGGEYGMGSATGGTPNLTPTSAGPSNLREDAFLANGMSNMSLGYDRQARSSGPGRIGQDRDNYTPTSAGPIGSQRPVNGNHDDSTRNGQSAVPERQPRGPTSDQWGSGFGRNRQNGHVSKGSDDSSERNGFTSAPRFM
ncbi:r3h domain protein [Rutstroemia sp. NJR-2017a BBW]|nr:r3h domain protein [Rutstroemia sp. NJR-2017a BBW]